MTIRPAAHWMPKNMDTIGFILLIVSSTEENAKHITRYKPARYPRRTCPGQWNMLEILTCLISYSNVLYITTIYCTTWETSVHLCRYKYTEEDENGYHSQFGRQNRPVARELGIMTQRCCRPNGRKKISTCLSPFRFIAIPQTVSRVFLLHIICWGQAGWASWDIWEGYFKLGWLRASPVLS